MVEYFTHQLIFYCVYMPDALWNEKYEKFNEKHNCLCFLYNVYYSVKKEQGIISIEYRGSWYGLMG